MSTILKNTICSGILNSLKSVYQTGEISLKLQKSLQIQQKNGFPELHLSISSLKGIFNESSSNELIPKILNISFDKRILNTSLESSSNPNNIIFKLDPNKFTEDTLNTRPNLKIASPETVIVEFSSPNIAKPFHVGHLRSTIIGNFVSNLYKSLGHNVIRINYLGDWGTQFGYLKVGMDLLNFSSETIRENPIKYLYEAYVSANKLGEQDTKISERAREIFCQLENEDFEDLDKWNLYRSYTIDELTKIYERLGVQFDEYCWESQYRKNKIEHCLNLVRSKGLVSIDSDGKQVIRFDANNSISWLKSDGTSLYVTRDLAALIDRTERFRFDKMFYVVENGQHHHFHSLFEIGRRIDVPNVDQCKHIKFGRIHGMSTRKGKVVFLSDILDEAQEIMRTKQIQSPTTKVDVSLDRETENILGVSAVIVNDLKQRRTRDYSFDWDKVLQVNGDTGIKLQYTHCRLCSLSEVTNIPVAAECMSQLLMEPEAQALVLEISRFPDIVHRSQDTLEASTLVKYLFSLSNTISRSLKVLRIKDHPNPDVQQQRMLLFMVAKQTLGDGMSILGLKPLQKM